MSEIKIFAVERPMYTMLFVNNEETFENLYLRYLIESAVNSQPTH